MSSRLRVALTLLILLGGFPAAAAAAAAEKGSGGLVGKEAPLFKAKQAGCKPFDLQAELREHKYVLINFWGLRCSSCIEEIPLLEEMHRKYSPRGFSVLGVNVDGVDCETLAAQIRKIGLQMSYEVLADEEMKVCDLYDLGGAPLTYIVNSEGKIIYQHAGFEEGDEEKMTRFLSTLFP